MDLEHPEETSLLRGDKIVDEEEGHSHKHKHKHSHGHKETFFSRFQLRCLNKEASFKGIAALTFLYSIAELGVAVLPPSSLTLLSDGFHNLSDVISLGIAYYASKAAKRDVTEEMSFGFGRVEILGGLTNAIFLLSLCLYVFLEAIPRLVRPVAVVDGIPFMVVAGVGLLVNTIGTIVFGLTGQAHSHSHGGHGHGHGHGKKDHNVWVVFLHFLGDMFSSLFVLIAGIIIHVADGARWAFYIDPISSLIIICLILYITIPVVKSCFWVLLQKAPIALDLRNLKLEILQVKGVVGIHDLHVWQFVDGLDVSSIHITYEIGADEENIIKKVKQIFHENNLHSSAIQLEKSNTSKSTLSYCSQNCIKDCKEDWCCKKMKKQIKKRKEGKYNTIENGTIEKK